MASYPVATRPASASDLARAVVRARLVSRLPRAYVAAFSTREEAVAAFSRASFARRSPVYLRPRG